MAATEPTTEHVKIPHACGHVVHCPREFMPPARLKKEKARNCRSCRKVAREVAAVRNQERGLPVLDAARGTRDQLLLAEELRDRHYRDVCAEAFIEIADPVRWIARFAKQDDCLLETPSREPEVCGAECAGDAKQAVVREFERIFGEGRRPPAARQNGVSPPRAERREPSAAPQAPRACADCGLVEDEANPLDVTLDRLLCCHCTPQDLPGAGELRESAAPKVALLGLARIQPSPLNPRKRFDEESLQELAASIREHGILQPLVVRQAGTEFHLIAGERRLRAARLAGLLNVPVIVREADEATVRCLMLCENLQRQDLDPIEEAQAYQGLRDLGWTLTQIGGSVGRSGPAVSNAMRLLGLPEEVRAMVADGRLSPAHGRALLFWADRPEECLRMAQEAVAHGYSSKALEETAANRRARRELDARYAAERAAIAAEEAAEAGRKGGEAPQPAEPEPLASDAAKRGWAGVQALTMRQRLEWEEARATWPARAEALAAAVARERERWGSILLDRRAVALLAGKILAQTRRGTLLGLLLARGLGDLFRLFDWDEPAEDKEAWAALAALPVDTLLELSFTALLQNQIAFLRESGQDARGAVWYAGEGCAAVEEEEA